MEARPQIVKPAPPAIYLACWTCKSYDLKVFRGTPEVFRPKNPILTCIWTYTRVLTRCSGLRQNMMFFLNSKMQWFRFSTLVLLAAALFIYLIRSVRNLQFWLLYYPSSSAPSVESLRANNVKLWKSSGADYRGVVAANEVGLGKGTLVVFHGNAGAALDRIYYLYLPGALSYRVILAEYPAYGGRKGKLGEKEFVSDAKETIRLAFDEYGGPLFLLGESMGCGVAAAAAAEMPARVNGVILITPWDTLASIAQSKFPIFPVRLFLQDRYDNTGNLASFNGRIAVVGAARDEVIPIRHAGNLYESLPGTSKNMWTIQGAGHNDWYTYVNEIWWKEIMDFVSGNNMQ